MQIQRIFDTFRFVWLHTYLYSLGFILIYTVTSNFPLWFTTEFQRIPSSVHSARFRYLLDLLLPIKTKETPYLSYRIFWILFLLNQGLKWQAQDPSWKVLNQIWDEKNNALCSRICFQRSNETAMFLESRIFEKYWLHFDIVLF